MPHPLLREENIVAGLNASTREEALSKMMELLPECSLEGVDKQKIFELLLLREQFGTTAIGHGIALPHCFSPDVSEPIIAFAVSSMGISFPSLDGRPVHFIFLLILPQNDTAEQQKREILQNIKWFLRDRFLQERLKAVRSAHEIFRLLSPEPQHVFALKI